MKKRYGFGETIHNVIAYVYTKIFWKNARLIRMPSRIRGRGCMEYGKGFTTGYNCRIEAGGEKKVKTLYIGNNVIIGDYAHIAAHHNMKIGNNVLIASRVYISDTSHGVYTDEDGCTNPEIYPNSRPICCKEVVIEDNVWIGENVCILPGVHIGKGCVIGANTTVTKDISEYSIVVGIPGRVIKKYNRDKGHWEKIH